MRLIMTLPVLAALTLGAVPVHATTYTAGEFVTFTAGAWGTPPDGFNAASLLNNNFGAVFPQIPAALVWFRPYLRWELSTRTRSLARRILFGRSRPSSTDPQYFLETATTISGYPDYYMPGVPSRLGANYNDFTFGPVHPPFRRRARAAPSAADAVALTLNVDFSDDGIAGPSSRRGIWRPHFSESRFAGGPEGEPPRERIGSDELQLHAWLRRRAAQRIVPAGGVVHHQYRAQRRILLSSGPGRNDRGRAQRL